MALYTKESLELLKNRIDLQEVLSAHMQLSRTGATYKGLCPFHEEKTPSFMVQRGDKHYHCFGCGAHGDAISFLMLHTKMGFTEAVESLAERFAVTLEKSEDSVGNIYKGPPKADIKNALEKGCDFFHFYLLHAEEARAALDYLFKRGIDLEFIKRFQIGYAPAARDLMRQVLNSQGISDLLLETGGLIRGTRPFFSERITFPIRDRLGSVIGFSARKIREETFGGKYINSPETPLFKKSRVLYGIYECRKRIASESKAIIVEGQIDALRCIHAGFNYTLAGQGTAFGEEHVNEVITLGAKKVYLLLDGDTAGRAATAKIGDLFQKRGIDVAVVALPDGNDPDSILQAEGPPGLQNRLDSAICYLTFLVDHLSAHKDLNLPAVKNEIAETISAQIRGWEGDLLIYESLKKLANLLKVPETLLGVHHAFVSPTFYKRRERAPMLAIDSDRILEGDLLRWLFLLGQSRPDFISLAEKHLVEEHFKTPICRTLFTNYLASSEGRDLLSLGLSIEDEQERGWLNELMQKKVNVARAEEGFKEVVQRLLQRDWLAKREAIRLHMQSGSCSEPELQELARSFDSLKTPLLT